MTNKQKAPADATPEPAFRFGLRPLLVLPLLVVAFLALTHWLNVYLAVMLMIPVGLSVACFFPRMRARAIRLLAAYLVCAGLVALSLPMVGFAREAARRSQCHCSMKMIAMALHNYHDTFGSFPPAYIADDDGRPIHSWRVLILPFLRQQATFDQYRFDEPWNGPNNIKLVDQMPPEYRCPSENSGDRTCTNCVAVLGPRTAWPGNTPVSLGNITDGPNNTWLVVEIADSGIVWSEPRDLHVLQMAQEINPPAGQGISSKHRGGANVACADGSIHFIGNATYTGPLSSEDVYGLLTIDGGEQVDLDW